MPLSKKKQRRDISVGGFPKQDMPDGGFVGVQKEILDLLLKQKKSDGILALYMFYLYTAKWQNTWHVKSTTGYVAKGLGITEVSVRRSKKILIGLGLIEDIKDKDSEGKIRGHYVKILNPYSLKTTPSFSPPLGNRETNAYTNNSSINAYTDSNKEMLNDTPTEIVTAKESDKSADKTLPLDGKQTTDRLYALYQDLWRRKYGTMGSWYFGRDKKILKTMSSNLGEYKTAYLLILYFGWRGVDGSDKFIEKILRNSCHSLLHINREVNPMMAYSKNVLGIDVQNEGEIIRIVNNKLKEYNVYRQN